MKTFISILLILGVAGYNIWVHYYNNDVDKYNAALKDYDNGKAQWKLSGFFLINFNKI